MGSVFVKLGLGMPACQRLQDTILHKETIEIRVQMTLIDGLPPSDPDILGRYSLSHVYGQ